MTNRRKQVPLINPYDVPAHDAARAHEDTARTQPSVPSTHRKFASTPTSSTTNAPDDLQTLPHDALIACRKSGGLMFRSREIVVYRDGRIVRRGAGGGQARFEDATQHLPSEQLAELAKLIKRVKFSPAADAAHHSPDAFVYEVAVRTGQTVKTAEVTQTSVPTALKSLIRWLDQHLSPSDV